MSAVIFVFIGVGVGGYYLMNSDFVNTLLENDDKTAELEQTAAKHKTSTKTIDRNLGTSVHPDETPDLPALRMLRSSGLTAGAEGMPEVSTGDQSDIAGKLAAYETCRFAFGIWEFSPNKRFRFLTTCEALEGQVLVGAYEVHGSKIRMSPLVDGQETIVSEFEVEKPSRMITVVSANVGGRPIVFNVEQTVTSIRDGLDGEAFRRAYESKNPIQLQMTKPGGGEAPRTGHDPLLDALKPK